MITIVELPNFKKITKKWLVRSERLRLHQMLCENPECGIIIKGTGGVRKMRFAVGRKGKRGGARVIYYYHVSETEIFLLDAYTKNQKENITPAQKKAIRQFVDQLTMKGEK